MSQIRRKTIGAVLLVFVLIFMSITVGTASEKVTVQAVAGGLGGDWYMTLSALSELINKKEPSIVIKVVQGGGITNPATIGEGKSDMGYVFPTFAKAAYEGTNPYTKRYPDLRVMVIGFGSAYLEISVLADRKIDSFEDVFRKKRPIRFLVNRKGTTTAWFFDRILEYYKVNRTTIEAWGGKVYYTAYADWPQLAKDGHIDLMFNQVSIPSAVLQEIASARKIKLLHFPSDLREFMAKKYALEKAPIPAGTYRFQKEDARSLRLSYGLAVRSTVPDRVVYRILEVIDSNIEQVKAIHPVFQKEFDIRTGWKLPGAPLHPAAERFYKDKGYMR